jgi:hypothetical protein
MLRSALSLKLGLLFARSVNHDVSVWPLVCSLAATTESLKSHLKTELLQCADIRAVAILLCGAGGSGTIRGDIWRRKQIELQ